MEPTWEELLNKNLTIDNIDKTGMCFMYKHNDRITLPTLEITIKCYDYESMIRMLPQ